MSVCLFVGKDWRIDTVYIYSDIARSFLKETLPPLQCSLGLIRVCLLVRWLSILLAETAFAHLLLIYLGFET